MTSSAWPCCLPATDLSRHGSEAFQPSRLGKQYLQTVLTDAIGQDDMESLRAEMFNPGKLSTRYQSVNVDIQRRVEFLK